MKNLKIVYMSLTIAGCWPGSAFALQVFNRSTSEKRVAILDKNGNQLAQAAAQAGKKVSLPSQAMAQLPLSIGWGELITVQKEPQKIVIEDYSSSLGWIITGYDETKNPVLVRLMPPKTTESIPKNATATYKKIGNNVVRVDTFPASQQDALTHKQTVQHASYSKAIQPNSYIIISQTKPDTVSVKVFHPAVVKAAAMGKKPSTLTRSYK